MTLKASTGFQTQLLAAFPTMFRQGAIYLFGGSRPDSANAEAGSAPLGIVTDRGLAWNPTNTFDAGLRFVQDGPYLMFDPAQRPLVTTISPGSVSWWRLVGPGDTLDASLDLPRLDGDVGLKASPGGQELLLTTDTLAMGVAYPIDYFLYMIWSP